MKIKKESVTSAIPADIGAKLNAVLAERKRKAPLVAINKNRILAEYITKAVLEEHARIGVKSDGQA